MTPTIGGGITKTATTVIVKVIVPGLHHWPDAPAEIETLRYCHPHHFIIRVGFKVARLDRQIEFFQAQGLIRKTIHDHYNFDMYTGYDFDDASCEMIAQTLLGLLQREGAIWVSVFEDDENGAQVEL